MKLYKREIRPMIKPPALQGFNDSPYPFYNEDTWISEDMEDYFREHHEKDIKDPMSRLTFDERYVEIELPISEVHDVKSGNLICFAFDPDKCDIDVAVDFANQLKGLVPDDVGIMFAPNIDVEVMDKETAYTFIDKMREQVDKLYKGD